MIALASLRSAPAAWRALPHDVRRRHLWLALALAVHLALCVVWRADFFYDATQVYLPHARRLLSEGPYFLADERSVWSPFMAYALPALFGAHVPTLMAVSAVLSAATLLLVYAIASEAHSPRAGLAAAWIYAVSPSVAQIVLNVSTEIPFLFLCALWLWALLREEDARTPRFIWLAGIALGLAANTRATIVPFVLLSAVVALVACAVPRLRSATWSRLARVQGIAAAIVMLVIVKNALLFGLPQVATGGGNAFYLGNHLLTGGYEPFYGGLFFDVVDLVHGNHLSVRADAILRDAGWQMLTHQPLTTTLKNWLHKTAAFVFYANAVIEDSLFTLRSWRIVLVALAVVALVRGRRSPTLLLAAVAAVLAIGVHVPLLYNPRYSEGSLELWLAILGGCGAASVSAWSRARLGAFALALLAVCYGGKTIRHLEGPLAPLHVAAQVPHRIAWRSGGGQEQGTPAAGAPVLSQSNPTLRVDVPDVDGFSGNAKYGRRNFFLVLDVATPAGSTACAKGRIEFTPARYSDAIVPASWYPLRLDTSAATQTFAFGIARATPTWQVPLDGPGTLTVTFTCATGEAVRIDRLAIAEATFGDVYGRAPEVPEATVPIVEYRHAALDRYFITWVPEEIALLDAHAGPRGWTRTGQTFSGFHLPARDRDVLCRFYAPPELGNLHVVGVGAADCEAIERTRPGYVREARDDVAHLLRPRNGECPAGTRPVWRLRGVGDAQRYAVEPAVRDAMLAAGWRIDGGAAGAPVGCAAQ